MVTEEDREYWTALKQIYWGLDKFIAAQRAEAEVLDRFERTCGSAFDRFLNRLDRIHKDLDPELAGSRWFQRIARGISSRGRLRRPAASGAPAAGARSRLAAAGGEAHAALVQRIDTVKAQIDFRTQAIDDRAVKSATSLRLQMIDLGAELRLEIGRANLKIDALERKLDWKIGDLECKLGLLERRLVALEKRRSVEQPAS